MQLKSWQILLILLVFGSLLGGVSRAGSEWRRYQGPDMMRVSQAGDLYIQALDKIFVYGADGIFMRSIDLARWGIQMSTGGFDVFSNGDLLLLEGSHGQGPLLQVLTFLRMEKLLLEANAETADGRQLVRCSPASNRCVPLPEFSRRFENTFRVQVDAQDRIFLADTARDTVSWLSSDGRLLDELHSGFRFPNQLALDGDALLVANTNHHEITRIPLLSDRFAAESEWQHLPVDGDVARRSGHIWPVEVVTAGDERFVMQMGDNLANGIVFSYDAAGNYRNRFTMPEGSDAVGLVYFRDELLVADPRSLAVWRYDKDGRADGQFGSYELASYLQTLGQQRKHYQTVEKRWWWAFGLVLAAGFVAALIGERRAQRVQQEQAVEEAHITLETMAERGATERPSADDPNIHWIAHDERRLRMLKMVGVAGVLLLLLLPLLQFSGAYAGNSAVANSGVLTPLLLSTIAMLLMLALSLCLIVRVLRNTRIGVLREWVILRNARGKTAVGRAADITLMPNAIAIGKVAINIGRRTVGELPERSLFDVSALQQWLAPRLLQAQELSGLAVFGWYFRQQPLQSCAAVIALLGLLGWRLLG